MLLTLACCLVMGVIALAAPSRALAIPYHAADSELVGTAYAVLNPTTGELDFVRSTETHADGSTGTVTSISGGTYTGTIFTCIEARTEYSDPSWNRSIGLSSVKSVRFIDAVKPRTTYDWFNGMNHCTSMDLSKLDTSQVTHMNWMFYGCQSLTSLDLSNFDTRKVTRMAAMFGMCYSLTSLDLSSFDTSQVEKMIGMFEYCQSLTALDVSSFDTSKVTDMDNMFRGCYSLTALDLSSFDTSHVTDMGSMFCNCYSLNKITFGDKFVIN